MKIVDYIYSLICGLVIGFLFTDFLMEYGINLKWYQFLFIWVLFSLFSLFCLWIAYIIGKKFPFVFQGSKFLLVGAFATVIDLKFFEMLVWYASSIPLTIKGFSFLGSTVLKFLGNKYWAFGTQNKSVDYGSNPNGITKNLGKEVIQFFFVTLIGLVIDVGFFHYFTRVLGPQFGVSSVVWLKLSVIFAGLAAAVWNFLGYKFIVFKK